MSFADIALACVAHGCNVIPCQPRNKVALVKSGKGTKWEIASGDPEQVRAWWAQWPDANVAIGCRKSNRCVLDVDHGLNSEKEARAWIARVGLPPTFTVRTGRRPEFGLQFHFEGVLPDMGEFQLDGCSGQIKSEGGYVMMPGSIHPDTGETYQVWADVPLAPIPDVVRNLRTVKREALNPDGTMQKVPEGAGRHAALMSFAGTLRNKGFDRDAILAQLIPANDAMCEAPVSDEDLEHIADSAASYALPEPEPVAVIGAGTKQPEPLKDWRELFHTREDALNAPPISFLIKGFLQREGVTAICGPVRERKSLIALNVVHALSTGAKLFDYFEVVRKPERVLYLCPEVSLGPFTDRLKAIGLMDHVGAKLFYRTLSKDGHLTLDSPELFPALSGSVVVLDTAIRFLTGDENSSQDVRAFADSIFALLRNGAESVVMLHHSPKGDKEAMTLENMMRGSGDMGAFLACCWGTKLQDPSKPYQSASFLSNLKQRDFESKDFEVTCGPDCRLHIVGDPETREATLQGRKGFKGNKDGKDEAAEAVIRAKVSLPVRKIQDELAGLGISRGTTWIAKARARVQMEAGTVTAGG
jgi:Bifunctional DNA primase/polymerase, N-terminal/AAA domain/Primase C terminal 1 (PriCT-1)